MVIRQLLSVVAMGGLAAGLMGCEPVPQNTTSPEPTEPAEEAGSVARMQQADRLETIDQDNQKMPKVAPQEQTYEGEVVEIEATTLRLRYEDGSEAEFALEQGAMLIHGKDKESSSALEVKAGDRVRLVTQKDSSAQDGTIEVVTEVHMIESAPARGDSIPSPMVTTTPLSGTTNPASTTTPAPAGTTTPPTGTSN
ncbi:hypothetical protein [Rubinisphaera margarita]|uniref:hypothetical protein n=1 Tax=Rubinisphaera margarita TaxID=2909586 RepID=UPI001EE86876|nr:hypothetical protein [Rubinisphaera margarita]MCG6155439.1 hypothetical protein [Rubinisphaera margarita]